ncbi:MAG: c-type cytochrome [Pseudomonadota bacterium]
MAAKTARCAFCHGEKGISGNPIWPSLAGLDAGYLKKRMESYRSSENTSPNALQMRFVLNGLEEDEIDTVAAYYSALEPAAPQGTASPGGARIYHQGVGDTVAPCASCHGGNGEGNVDLNAPRLAGQSAHYMSKQLAAYAAGLRPDNDSTMAETAGALSPDQRAAVSTYLQALLPTASGALSDDQ